MVIVITVLCDHSVAYVHLTSAYRIVMLFHICHDQIIFCVIVTYDVLT